MIKFNFIAINYNWWKFSSELTKEENGEFSYSFLNFSHFNALEINETNGKRKRRIFITLITIGK